MPPQRGCRRPPSVVRAHLAESPPIGDQDRSGIHGLVCAYIQSASTGEMGRCHVPAQVSQPESLSTPGEHSDKVAEDREGDDAMCVVAMKQGGGHSYPEVDDEDTQQGRDEHANRTDYGTG